MSLMFQEHPIISRVESKPVAGTGNKSLYSESHCNRRRGMVNWKKAEHEPGRFLKELNVDEIYDQLDSIRGYLKDLAGSFGRKTSREWSRSRDLVADTAGDAEETIKENLAASLIVAIGIGVLIGYMIAHRTE